MPDSASTSDRQESPSAESKPDTPLSGSTATISPFEPPAKWRIWALIAGVTWFGMFAVGTLIDSAPYREALGWEGKNKTIDDSKKLNQQISDLNKQVKELKDSRPLIMADPGKAIDKLNEDLREVKTHVADLTENLNPLNPRVTSDSFVVNFVAAAFTFMPLNVGVLCILAAFIGGCSVNKEKIWSVHFQRESLPAEGAEQERFSLTRQLLYLTEHPSYSAVRGLVVYLVLISGFFIVGPDTLEKKPEQVEVFTNYIKFAGLSSFFGYLAGYDPTLFSSLINLGSSRLRLPQGGK